MVTWLTDQGGWRAPASGGGGSPAYAPLTTPTLSNTAGSGDFGVTFTGETLGAGSVFAIFLLNNHFQTPFASVTVNGANLSFVKATASNKVEIWAGPVTLTGSDTVVATTTGDISFGDVNIVMYGATNLISTTPLQAIINVGSDITVPAAVGNFIFVGSADGSASTTSFNGSAQTPDHGFGIPGVDPTTLNVADWTAASGGISGGDFTATYNTFAELVIAVWN